MSVYARSFAIQMGPKLVCPLYGILAAGCPLLRGFEFIEAYGDAVRAFRNVRYNNYYIASVRR